MAEPKREFTFLSYANEDLELVWKIHHGLERRKVSTWFDKKNRETGRWRKRIEKAISKSRYFIFCLSNASLKKTGYKNPGYIDNELQIAWEFAREQDEKDFTIVPVRLEDCDRGDMRLSGWEQYDLFEDFEKKLDELAVDIGGVALSDIMVKDERTEDQKLYARKMGEGAMYFYSGEYDEALARFETASIIRSDDAEAWTNKGAMLGELERHKEALDAFNKAIEIQPDFHKAWTNKGIALYDLGRYKEALDAFNKAIEIQPDHAIAWTNKGVALLKLGRNDEALYTINKAIDIKPDNYEAWYNNGVALFRLGRKKKAQKAFKKANELIIRKI